CAVIRDITQWKRTEEELRNAKRAAETANAHKTDFLARVSHEIRTPLNAIIGFADMMATERFGPIGHPRYVEYANDIGRSGRHVLDIVNDLLDISKIEAGQMDVDFI
ncbi:histidine kinase dimerization/phospho-acceptor domain-containing protein, partial [Mesorhizobium sp. M8A.F.Ca.ET.161.01.1.1]